MRASSKIVKIILPVAVLIVAALGLTWLVLRPTSTPARTAALSELVNEVKARPAAERDWEPATDGQVVRVGGGVRTSADARARVDISDGAILRVAANSEFELKELSGTASDPVTRLTLTAGKLWTAMVGALGGGTLEIETPAGTATVRGSFMSVEVTTAAEMVITCLEGQCRLTGASGKATDLSDGQQAAIPGIGQDPSPAKPMDLEQYEDWAQNFPEAPAPTATPEPTISPAPTATPEPTLTPVPTVTPIPIGEADTGMGGNLSIRGMVRDSSGAAASNVYVTITVYEPGGGGDRGQLWNGEMFTDGAGAYAFNHLLRVEGGHYEVWFNGRQEYGRVYESSGYYIYANEISGDVYFLNVTVHPVTGSAFSGVIQYEDADGVTKNFLSSPLGLGHYIELMRGTSANREYPLGSEYFTNDGSRVYLGGLAGGTYYLAFQYRRSDGVWVETTSPSIEILPGETKQFDYTIPLETVPD